VADVIFDRKEQLQKIQRLLVPNETLYAVYDLKGSGTGFIGITDLRLVFMDQAFLRSQKAVVSLPFSRITAVAAEDSGQILLGSLLGTNVLTIIAGTQQWTFEFRSDDKAHEAYGLMMRNLLQTEARGI
jgi:hypothetical protein